MFPLAAIGTGVNILGSIAGLFGASRAERQARQAEEAAIRDLQLSGEQEYNAALTSGSRGLYGLQGRLNDALGSGGRALGAGMAGAGVTNSSATAGALANQGASNAAQTSGYASNLAELLARIKAENLRSVAGLKTGYAQNNLNYARQQLGSTVGGIGSMLGQLGQMNFGGVGGRSPQSVGSAGDGKANGSFQIPSVMDRGLGMLGVQPSVSDRFKFRLPQLPTPPFMGGLSLQGGW